MATVVCLSAHEREISGIGHKWNGGGVRKKRGWGVRVRD
jgi:hypothetical protein